jgi:hypothetical protein
MGHSNQKNVSPKIKQMKASILFFLNEAKKNPKNGKIPIYMRICYRQTKAESRLNAEILDVELFKWDPRTMRISEHNSSVNYQLKVQCAGLP